MPRLRPGAGPRWRTARRWSPANVAARASSRCSMSAPTRAGRICRCPAVLSKCCGGSSTCPAIRPRPARALRARPMSRRWRRCARSTALAPSGRRPRPQSRCRPITATAMLAIALVAALLATAPSPVRAQGNVQGNVQGNAQGNTQANDEFAQRSVSQTRLAYVVTGNADVDSIVKAGLAGLTLFLAQRTALEAGDPVGVDPSRDELAFFPLIYWPVVPGAQKPSQDTLNRVDAYMKQGGTVLFDTRDAIEAPPGENGASQTPGMRTLREILSSLDVPELEPVPREHVLTKTFYLLRDFPGRFNSGQTWVETLPREDDDDAASRPARGGDGVSPVIITSNDLAGAWAHRPDGQPMLPLTPGEPRQREFAFRSGVNIVMYTLTGNYKADQVHAPALIERLGQ